MILKPRLFRKPNLGHPLMPDGGLWLLNEGSGNKVFDLSGNGIVGTFGNQTSWTPGISGPAIRGDGFNDYIKLDTESKFDGLFSAGLTIKTRVKRQYPSESISWETIWSLRTNEDAGIAYFLQGRLYALGFLRVDDEGTGAETETVNTVAPLGSDWFDTVVVFDWGSSIRIYIDGIEDTNSKSGTCSYVASLGPLYLLAAAAGSGSVGQWDIDHIMIFNRALSASEITQLFIKPFCMFEPSWNWVLYGAISAEIELDYMEYATDAAAQAAYVSSGTPSSWDLLDEDCSDISDWIDFDTGNGVSEVSPASQFRMDANKKDSSEAARTRDIGSFPNIFTVEAKLYHDKVGPIAHIDCFMLRFEKDDVCLHAQFVPEGLYISDGDNYNEVGTDLVKQGVSAEWQTWRFVIDFTVAANAVCDVYLTDSTHENEKVGSAIDCSHTGTFEEGKVRLKQYGYSVDDCLTHIDYIKIVTGAYGLDLQSYSEDTIKEQGDYSLKAIAKQTGSLNDTLTRTIVSPIDLSDQKTIKFDARASRTGSQFKVGIHDSGGITTERIVNIAGANVWQTEAWNISGVSNENKDAIDNIIITITNADAANTIYIDNIYACEEEAPPVGIPIFRRRRSA